MIDLNIYKICSLWLATKKCKKYTKMKNWSDVMKEIIFRLACRANSAQQTQILL